MDTDLYANAISRAVEDFEGYGTLAVILNVSVADLRQWAEGQSYPPAEVLRRIVELTQRHDGTPNRPRVMGMVEAAEIDQRPIPDAVGRYCR